LKFRHDYPINNVKDSNPHILWFYKALMHQYRSSEENCSTFGTYYEFGTGGGGLLFRYIKSLKRFCKDFEKKFSDFKIYSFDSFEGLPESKLIEDTHPTWKKGEFSYTIDEVRKNLETIANESEINTIQFIKGFYEEKLTEKLRHQIKDFPPSIVSIDVDYYSSTKIVLEWLRPILSSGTLFYFDDIWSFHGNPNYGELKAIKEFNNLDDGYLTPFPDLGLESRVYIYSKKFFEYV